MKVLHILHRAPPPLLIVFPVAFSAVLSVSVSTAFAASDPRFGFVGTGGKAFAQKFGVPYYALEGNYDASTGTQFSSVHPANDPPAGYRVLRKVAKLNVRTDGLGQTNAQFQAAFEGYAQNLTAWYNVTGTRPAKPAFTWYAPNAAALAAAESLQIVNTIRREKTLNPAVTGTVWEIGNEPNFFPAILPAEYAAIYANYHRIIKREDSTARIAFGPVFIRETGDDLKPMTRELIVAKLTQSGALALLGQARFDSLAATVDSVIFSRVFNLGTVQYVSQAFAALPSNVRPDYLSLHVYPYDDRPPALTKANIQTKVDSLVAALATVTGSKPVWITEFGNVNASLSASAVALAMSDLIDVLTANAGIGNLFYYKATGADQQLDLLAGLGVPGAPLTRLANDSAFSPATGHFSCGQLNAIGGMYYQRVAGAACADGITLAAPVLVAPAQFATGVPVSTALVWNAVTGATSYRVQVSTSPDFATPVVHDSAAPGPARGVGPLAGATSYYWRVRARNVSGEGAWSEIGTFATLTVLPEAPVPVSPAAFATGVPASTDLIWTAAAGAAFYGVQLAIEPSFAAPLIHDTTVTGTTRATGVLAGNTDYYWRVNARNAAGASAFSTTRKFTTGTLPLPGVPTLVSPAQFASLHANPVTLVWNKSAFAAGYHLQVAANPAFAPLIHNDSTLSDTVGLIGGGGGGPVEGSGILWRVRARNASGGSDWSEIRSFSNVTAGVLPRRLSAFRLGFNGPRSGRTLRFELPRRERVTIRLLDIRGTQLFKHDGEMAPGPHEVTLPAVAREGVLLLDLRMGAVRESFKLSP